MMVGISFWERREYRTLAIRLAIGLIQGLALYGLDYARRHHLWPATDPYLFQPAMAVFVFLPIVIAQGLGNIRLIVLSIWALAAAALCAGLTYYAVWHDLPGHASELMTLFYTGVFLFAGQGLITAGDLDRRIIGRYAGLFDQWLKLAVQFAIVGMFVGVFWVILYLGAGLFDLIHLDFFRDTIRKNWFAFPASFLALAAAIHITDGSNMLVRGVRTLALVLLGWLLPLIALIAAGFLIALIFTGLQPLWDTRFATALLLSAAWALILMVNAAYQDGGEERKAHIVQRIAGSAAGVMLPIIVALAGYAVYLRVAQYGWTSDRIFSAAGIAVFALTAIGYAVAAFMPGIWLKLIERINIAVVLFGMALILILFTPIADPYRLSVADQVNRLNTGAVKPDTFDFNHLRWHGGRFGLDALRDLAKSKDPVIAKRAAETLEAKSRLVGVRPADKATPSELADRIKTYPEGKLLPDSFLNQNWDQSRPSGGVTSCLTGKRRTGLRCAARIEDFDADGKDDVLILSWYANREDSQFTFITSALFQWDGKLWRWTAQVMANALCMGDRDALLHGKAVKTIPTHPLPILSMNGRNYVMVPQTDSPDCP